MDRSILPPILLGIVVCGLALAFIRASEVQSWRASEVRSWRAVQLADGQYSVRLCTDDGDCATSGAGITGYRFDNPDDAKRTAARLQSIHRAPEVEAVLVP